MGALVQNLYIYPCIKIRSMTLFRIILLTLSLALGTANVFAQVRSISYDISRNTFEGDYDLPADKRFNIVGYVDGQVDLVEVDIYRGYNKKEEKNIIYQTDWLRSSNDIGNQFFLSIKQPLRSGQSYDFTFRYFKSIGTAEKDYTQEVLLISMQNYLLATARADKKELVLVNSPEEMRKELNTIVINGLQKYRSRDGESFPGFSDILVRQLEDFSNVSGNRAKAININEEKSLQAVFDRIMDAILEQVALETQQYLNNPIFIQTENRTLTNYPVEKTRNEIAINIGYGGAWFDGGFDDFNYGHRPYAGLSFPLGNKAHSKKFWSNASINTGVFLMNFKDKDDNVLKGPIIQRPLYLGVGYKVFSFIRFNAGAVLLEQKQEDGGFINGDKIKVRPFIGLSAEFKFWGDFAK